MTHPRQGLGAFIRTQRAVARLSLRQLARGARISSPYLSQVERGLYQPSAPVLKAIAGALGISPLVLYARAGWLEEDGSARPRSGVEEAIRLDPQLTPEQKAALIRIYRALLEAQG